MRSDFGAVGEVGDVGTHAVGAVIDTDGKSLSELGHRWVMNVWLVVSRRWPGTSISYFMLKSWEVVLYSLLLLNDND